MTYRYELVNFFIPGDDNHLPELPVHHPHEDPLLAGACRASRKRRKALQDLRGVERQRSPQRADGHLADRRHPSPKLASLRRRRLQLGRKERLRIKSLFNL